VYVCECRGHIAERTNMRYFLTAGMVLSGITTILFGYAYYWNIHVFAYFVIIQVCAGTVFDYFLPISMILVTF